MDRNIVSDRPHCAELRYFQQRGNKLGRPRLVIIVAEVT
jgi:hypothetical protein